MKRVLTILLYTLLMAFVASTYCLVAAQPLVLWGVIPLFVFIVIFAGTRGVDTRSVRLRVCHHGAVLLLSFLLSTVPLFFYHIVLAVFTIRTDVMVLVWSLLYAVATELLFFWSGILSVYLTSVQLGIRQRVLGVVCGWIPLVNIVVLAVIIQTVFREVRFESEKELLNRSRAQQQVCKTRYPILMVHGVFFRDSHVLNYWGRIPAELERNGAQVYYGNHHSASSVADSAAELTARIKALTADLGCEKVNIIAHSKGGLDCRYALSFLDAAPYVASLTTINTPHRGCLFAEYLLHKIPEQVQQKVANTYNKTLKKIGDTKPDFLAAVSDLTDSVCTKRDAEMIAPEGVFCQSVGSVMPRARGGTFPMNFTYHLVKYFSGANDGLVSEFSFRWGERYTLLFPKRKRGISHSDMVDLNRENIDEFDVREFYVGIVSDLKDRGL